MDLAIQSSLFEDVAPDSPLAPLSGATRRELSAGAWVDVCPGWLRTADELFDVLQRDVPWRTERRQMYDRVVDVPRLVSFYPRIGDVPHPVVSSAKTALDEHYEPDLGEPFLTAGLCLYRDGRDSVAWHGDDTGRGKHSDTLIAIASLGSTRTLALRPRDGGPSLRFDMHHGDLVVMGGSCQRTWQHAIPKTSKPVGPRMSIQFRPYNVR